ncbi:MAG: long-chain-fatty-acid--CoA ligase [Myxococcota bacterium]
MGLNLAVILRESAKNHGDGIALIAGESRVTYAQLHATAQRFAGGLWRLGVRPGQHVALMLPNVPHFSIAYFGTHYAAGTVVPLNVMLQPDEIAYHLEDSDAGAMVVWEDYLERAQAAFGRVPGCKHLIVCKRNPTDPTAPAGAVSMAALLQGAPPVTELPSTMPDDTAVILYTSGTTGRPKGAELTHFNLLFNAEVVSTRLMPLDETTVALTVLPLFHSFGQTVMHNAVLMSGGTVVLLSRFEAAAALQVMHQHRVTFFSGVPTMYFALLHHPDADAYDLSSLRHCISGGAPMPVEVMRAFDHKHGVNILEGYGLSETSPVASQNRLDRPKKPGSIGLPLWGVELQLVDERGRVIDAPDTPGEIVVKGHNVMKGYYKRPEATAEAVRDGWLHTGDIATRDADGFYYIVDRKKDLILRGGYNVYPREIEEVLYGHPAVAEAAVIGVPDERLGEEVQAVVALKPGRRATAEELIAHCKGQLAAYKCPRNLELRPELPKGPTGKILKRALR